MQLPVYLLNVLFFKILKRKRTFVHYLHNSLGEIMASKLLLGLVSEVFKAQFFGKLPESSKEREAIMLIVWAIEKENILEFYEVRYWGYGHTTDKKLGIH